MRARTSSCVFTPSPPDPLGAQHPSYQRNVTTCNYNRVQSDNIMRFILFHLLRNDFRIADRRSTKRYCHSIGTGRDKELINGYHMTFTKWIARNKPL